MSEQPDWFEDEPFEEVLAAFESGEKGLTGPPEPTTGPLSRYWDCPHGHMRISTSQPSPGGRCYCGAFMVLSQVTS